MSPVRANPVLAALATAALFAAAARSDISTSDPAGAETGAVEDGGTDVPITDRGTPPDSGSVDSTDSSADTETPGAPRFPLTPEPYTTLQRVWAPLNPPESTGRAIDDELESTDIDKYTDSERGVEPIAGKEWVEHTELAPGYPGPLAGERRRLLSFWQSADP